MTPVGRLRSLVKEATQQAPGPWTVHPTKPSLILTGAAWTSMAVGSPEVARLLALAPQLAELVADMAEALNEVLSDGDLPDEETDAMVVAVLVRLAALFPEDNAT